MNKDLNDTIKKFYLDEISAVELADAYYNEGLYSAAAGYYQAYISSNKYADINEEKSYCLFRIACCYRLQTNRLSQWQYQTIYECLRSAINYNPKNYQAYILLIDLLPLQTQKSPDDLVNKKEEYYLCEYVIMNLLDLVRKKDVNDVAQMIIKFYELAEHFFICKYKCFEKYIMKFLANNSNVISTDLYNSIIESMNSNHKKDDFEIKIMNNSYFKL